MQDGLNTLAGLGFSWPSPAYIVGALLFGVLGMAAFAIGRRSGRRRTTWLGLALMLYPYLISQTWLLYAVGVALCGAVWFDRGS